LGAPVERLDVATVLKAAQAVSGEVVLDKLIEKPRGGESCHQTARAGADHNELGFQIPIH
jgi:hypothetical protein